MKKLLLLLVMTVSASTLYGNPQNSISEQDLKQLSKTELISLVLEIEKIYIEEVGKAIDQAFIEGKKSAYNENELEIKKLNADVNFWSTLCGVAAIFFTASLVGGIWIY